jgi:serine protease DegS
MRMKWYRAFNFLFTSVATGLAAAFLVLLLRPDLAGTEAPPAPKPELLERTGGPVSYADAVQRAAPSVVNVFATKVTREKRHPIFDDPVFKRFFGNQATKPRIKRENSLGSGVIVDGNGYVLTNNHVIDAASEINVVLDDGRSLPARVVGTDPETDIAVLQAAGSKLPVASLGESEQMQVGDVVMAIGNPFGVGQTVTMGIVSATGRNDRRSLLYEDFIQTDAAINAGNSGGALVNANGDLIGISTRKLGASTGAQNIGFAIPVSMAKRVMEQIIEYGTVRRAWLGATFVDIRPTLQPDGSVARTGIAVGWVAEQGPAWEAGIRQGDVIVSLDGQPVTDASQFQLAISEREPGSKVELGVNRRLESFQTYATLIQQPPLQ